MKRFPLRLLIAALLLAVTYLAGKIWLGKYDSSPDPLARYEIQAAKLKRDRSNYWLELHLQKAGSKDHDLEKPVRLITHSGTQHEPADFRLAGSPEKGFTDLWFKFWLDETELENPIQLQINDAQLKVKKNQGFPKLSDQKITVIPSSNWQKKWFFY